MPRVAASSQVHTYVSSAEESAAVAAFVEALDESGLSSATGRPALVAANGDVLEMPEAMLDALRQVAIALSSGLGVTVAPLSTLLTTQEAADYLGISRPTLVRILQRGEIPMEKPGRHRFVQLTDVIEYKERDDVHRRGALKALIEDAESNDLYAKTDRHPPAAR
jgi:excisionase family DNA binding protein